MSNIAKIQKSIKRKATTPKVPQTPVTPVLKQSPVTPSSSKKPKFSFPTRSKGKRLLPKTPQKTPLSAKGSVAESPWTFSQPYKTPPKSKSPASTSLPFATAHGTEPWDTPAEKAASAVKRITRAHRKQHGTSLYKAAKQGAKKGVLKKLETTAGWKPFGMPTKKKLDGKDWKTKTLKTPRKRRQQGGKFDFQKAIEKTGVEFHIPTYRYAGPGTKLAKRLKRRDKPKNRLGRIAMHHDIAYSKAKNLQDKWKAHDVMIKAIDRLPRKKTKTEKVDKKIMQANRKLKL